MATGRFTFDDLFRHVANKGCDVHPGSSGVYRIQSRVSHSDPKWAVVTTDDPAREEPSDNLVAEICDQLGIDQP